MASIQKGQSYPDLGFSVDGKGIATDLKTGQTLSRQDVDSRLSGSGMDNIAKQRGGLNGFYDHNKSWAVPVAELGAGLLGGPGAAAAIGAAAGANSLKNPNLVGALKGGATGYGLGGMSSGLAGAAQGGMQAAGAAGQAGSGLLGQVGAGLKTALPAALSSATGGAVSSGAPLSLDSLVNAAKGAVGNAPSAISGLLGKAGSFLTGNGGLNVLGTAQGINAAMLGQKSSDYAKSALGSVTDAYNAKAPLRATGIQNMTSILGQPAPSTSPLAQIAGRNVFAAR